ncbi:MAG: glycosyltransferase family 2 protein [Nitrososphaerales archaeon]
MSKTYDFPFLDQLGLSVIVPVFEEEKAIVPCINKIVKSLDGLTDNNEILIIDDQSKDKTFELVINLAKAINQENKGRIKVFRQKNNRGKGNAIKIGLLYATKDIIFIQDAYLEYDPKEIPNLIKPIIRGEADIVYGSRFLGSIEGMSVLNYFGNRIITNLTNILYGSKLSDVMTGHKAFKKGIFKHIEIKSSRFLFEIELTVKILRKNFRIIEVPINYKRRRTGRSKIKWIDGLKGLIALVIFRFFNFFIDLR